MNLRPLLLVVDDNEINLDIYHEILDDDYTVLTATNGRDACELARQHRPEVILLDVMLPVMDGCEVCRRLRGMPELETTTVIMVSAKALANERAAGFAAGADAYVTKPFDYADLLTAIRQRQLSPRSKTSPTSKLSCAN